MGNRHTRYSHNTITWHYLDQGPLTKSKSPRLFDSGLSNNAKCVSQPASICQPVMHSEPLCVHQSPMSRLYPEPSSLDADIWQIVTMQHDTGWHSPLLWCCHVHQARPLVRLSRGAQLAGHWPVMQPQATIETREAEGTQSGCQLKLRTWKLSRFQ